MYCFNRAFVPVAIAIGYLVSMPLLALLFSPVVTEGVSPACSFGLHALLLFSLGVLLNIPGPALKALLLNVNRPHCRGTATAVGELFNNAGRILGPVVFTWLLRTRDRVASTLSVSNFFYISAALSFLLCYTVEDDEDAVKEYVKNIKVSPMEREDALESRGEDAPLLPCSVSSTNTAKTRRSLIVHPRRRFHRRLLHVSSHRHCWHSLYVGHSLHVGHCWYCLHAGHCGHSRNSRHSRHGRDSRHGGSIGRGKRGGRLIEGGVGHLPLHVVLQLLQVQ